MLFGAVITFRSARYDVLLFRNAAVVYQDRHKIQATILSKFSFSDAFALPIFPPISRPIGRAAVYPDGDVLPWASSWTEWCNFYVHGGEVLAKWPKNCF